MINPFHLFRLGSLLALLALGGGINTAVAQEYLPTDKQCRSLENPDAATQGWCAAINRRKGNCLACHNIATNRWPSTLPPGGNVGPPLVSMKKRYPDKAKLRAQIWNALDANPHSVMPPFGKNKIISEQDIDNIVEFLLTI